MLCHNILVLVSILHVYGGDNICKKVTMFDAICKTDDVVYILSASPCISSTSIGVTIVEMNNFTSSFNLTTKSINEPIPVGKKTFFRY